MAERVSQFTCSALRKTCE